MEMNGWPQAPTAYPPEKEHPPLTEPEAGWTPEAGHSGEEKDLAPARI